MKLKILLLFMLLAIGCKVPMFYQFPQEQDEYVIVVLHGFDPDADWSTESLMVGEVICAVTDSKYWHTSLIIDGMRYDIGHPLGLQVRPVTDKYTVESEWVKLLRVPASPAQKERMKEYYEILRRSDIKYNYQKLVALAWMYPLRGMYNGSEHVPFSSDIEYGQICSVNVNEYLLYAGIDLFPHLNRELIVPEDYNYYYRRQNK